MRWLQGATKKESSGQSGLELPTLENKITETLREHTEPGPSLSLYTLNENHRRSLHVNDDTFKGFFRIVHVAGRVHVNDITAHWVYVSD